MSNLLRLIHGTVVPRVKRIKSPKPEHQHIMIYDDPDGQRTRYSVVSIVGYDVAAEKQGCAEQLLHYMTVFNAPVQ